MANIKSAIKRAKQAVHSRRHNMAQRSRMRTQIKNTYKAIEAGKLDDAKQAFSQAVPAIDAMVSKGLIHKNKAARHKQRLNKHIKNLAA